MPGCYPARKTSLASPSSWWLIPDKKSKTAWHPLLYLPDMPGFPILLYKASQAFPGSQAAWPLLALHVLPVLQPVQPSPCQTASLASLLLVQPVLAAWLPDSQKQSSLAILARYARHARLASQARMPGWLEQSRKSKAGRACLSCQTARLMSQSSQSCCLARYARLLTMLERQSCLACIRKSKAGW